MTESCCDFLHVQISTDAGAAWTDLVAAYSGTHTTWSQRDLDLATYTGSALVRFWLHTDGSVTNDGWFVDDLEVSRAQSCTADMVYQSNSFTDDCPNGGAGDGDGVIDAGETLTIHPTLANSGSQAATGLSA